MAKFESQTSFTKLVAKLKTAIACVYSTGCGSSCTTILFHSNVSTRCNLLNICAESKRLTGCCEKKREETIRLWGKNRREAKLLLIRSFVYPLSIAINLFERLSLSVQTEFLYELLCYLIFAACTYSASIYFMEMIRTSSSASQDDARGRVNNTNTKFYFSIFNSHKIQLRPSSYSRKLFQVESNFQ